VSTQSKSFPALLQRICSVVEAASGNRFGPAQMSMVEARVRRRIAQLGIESDKYAAYLESNLGTETSILISLLTTHHTFFFREFLHFEYLAEVLPQLVQAAKERGDKQIRIWSAAASRGHEVYSLAMFLEKYLPKVSSEIGYSIVGTDIDLECVAYAKNGVYPLNEVSEIPLDFQSFWVRGTGEIANFAKMRETLRRHCQFAFSNLADPISFPSGKFDAIFCRNVLIYFHEEQVRAIAKALSQCLYPQGYLITGVSESLSSLLPQLGLRGAAQASVYQLDTANGRKRAPKKPEMQLVVAGKTVEGSTRPLPSARPVPSGPLRVLCVDDSPTVLMLLKQILVPDNGFQVVGTAANGQEAIAQVAALKPDLMTLDIHMPIMDGLTYLEKQFSADHPPTVVISSASRSDSEVALKALRLGASDFVEKPALGNIQFRGNEIRTKLKVALWNKGAKADLETETLVMQPAMELVDTAGLARVVLTNLSSWDSVQAFFKSLTWNEPPCFVFFEGNKELLGAFAKKLSSEVKFVVSEVYDAAPSELKKNSIYIADFEKWFGSVKALLRGRSLSISVFGACTEQAVEALRPWKGSAQILVEDSGANLSSEIVSIATDMVPATSFPYLSNQYFSKRKIA
jgi:chemotaxis protein methyltransferase CheR